MIKNSPRNFAIRLLLLVVSLLAWEGLVRFLAVPAFFGPAPSSIFVALYRGIVSRGHVDHLWVALSETLPGFAFARAVALLLGVPAALSRRLGYFLHPS